MSVHTKTQNATNLDHADINGSPQSLLVFLDVLHSHKREREWRRVWVRYACQYTPYTVTTTLLHCLDLQRVWCVCVCKRVNMRRRVGVKVKTCTSHILNSFTSHILDSFQGVPCQDYEQRGRREREISDARVMRSSRRRPNARSMKWARGWRRRTLALSCRGRDVDVRHATTRQYILHPAYQYT